MLALWFYPSLLIASALWIVIWRFALNESNYIEIKDTNGRAEYHLERNSDRLWTSLEEIESEKKPDPELGQIELQGLEEEVIIPYSTFTAVLVFGLFAITFIAIMTIGGLLHNPPILFKFFSDIYLAGALICG